MSRRLISFLNASRRSFHDYLSRSRFGLVLELLIGVCALTGLLFLGVLVGMRFSLFNVRGSIDERNAFFLNATSSSATALEASIQQCIAAARANAVPGASFGWAGSPEWQTLSAALRKDEPTIDKAALDAGIPPRLLVSVVIAEQLRFFTSDRESFKKFFEPLKILGSLSQFSLGVSGVKPDTAKEIEAHLKDPSSPYFVSTSTEHLLDVSGDDQRYSRLTDAHDHYYSYLYTAMFVREVESQWQKAGYDLSGRPEILATIFNLGFGRSNPGPSPVVAGSTITVGGQSYSFGRLAYEFYYSGELADIFPYGTSTPVSAAGVAAASSTNIQ